MHSLTNVNVRARRRGYVSLLAISFAFGLATLGAAVAIGASSYIRAAASAERDILDRISLESATSRVLGQIALGRVHKVAPHQVPDIIVNARRVGVQLSLLEGKRDLVMDENEIDTKTSSNIPIFTEDFSIGDGAPSLSWVSGKLKLSADGEDCFRSEFTLGRSPEPFDPTLKASPAERVATAGDQIDVRASTRFSHGWRVLWVRARFEPFGRWRLHDWRQLQTSAATCGPN